MLVSVLVSDFVSIFVLIFVLIFGAIAADFCVGAIGSDVTESASVVVKISSASSVNRAISASHHRRAEVDRGSDASPCVLPVFDTGRGALGNRTIRAPSAM